MKFRLLLLPILFISTTCEKSKHERKILHGGELASTLETPWVVSVVGSVNGRDSKCTGVLISPNFVLTARHCFLSDDDKRNNAYFWKPIGERWDDVHGCDDKDLIVPAGFKDVFTFKFNTICRTCDHYGVIIRKAKKIILPGMCVPTVRQWENISDLAIVELFEPVDPSPSVLPANISYISPEDAIGLQLTVAGYGEDPADRSQDKLKYYPTNGLRSCGNILSISDYLCANALQYGALGCEGDSGAGAVLTQEAVNEVIGILSRSSSCSNTGGREKAYFLPLSKHAAEICKYSGICP